MFAYKIRKIRDVASKPTKRELTNESPTTQLLPTEEKQAPAVTCTPDLSVQKQTRCLQAK